MLKNYFEKISNSLIHNFNCIKAVAILRETLRDMVVKIISNIDFDYKSYNEQNLENFDKVYKNLKF